VISRLAEACFGLGLALERAAILAQALEVQLASAPDLPGPEAERWRPLLLATGESARFDPAAGTAAAADEEAVQEFLVWREDGSSSLAGSLRSAHAHARACAETLGPETRETLAGLELWLASADARRVYERERAAFYRRVRDGCWLFQGMSLATLPEGEAFDFLRLGTALERTGWTARLLELERHALGPWRDDTERAGEVAWWLAVLRMCAASEPFFHGADLVLSGPAVAEYLLLERSFPRSVRHGLETVEGLLARIRRPAAPEVGARSQRCLADLRTRLEELPRGERLVRELSAELAAVVAATGAACRAVREDFFAPPPGGACRAEAGAEAGAPPRRAGA
jgi:uncharacterized alpha-E superfamily protein